MKPTHNERRKKALRWLNSVIAYFINSLNLEPVALAAGSDAFIQDDEGVQEMRKNPVIIKNARPTPNIVRTVSRSTTRENYITSRV